MDAFILKNSIAEVEKFEFDYNTKEGKRVGGRVGIGDEILEEEEAQKTKCCV